MFLALGLQKTLNELKRESLKWHFESNTMINYAILKKFRLEFTVFNNIVNNTRFN